VDSCKICQAAGEEKINTHYNMIETNHIGELWEVDLIGRIEDRKKNSKFILECVDHFSKWVSARVVETKSGKSVSHALAEIIEEWGVYPKRILSDIRLEFKAKEMQEIAKDRGIEWIFNSPYHHETIGLVE
ncbi:hypothetical protein ENBRE01_3296, partial [Enteropsectra breve]